MSIAIPAPQRLHERLGDIAASYAKPMGTLEAEAAIEAANVLADRARRDDEIADWRRLVDLMCSATPDDAACPFARLDFRPCDDDVTEVATLHFARRFAVNAYEATTGAFTAGELAEAADEAAECLIGAMCDRAGVRLDEPETTRATGAPTLRFTRGRCRIEFVVTVSGWALRDREPYDPTP